MSCFECLIFIGIVSVTIASDANILCYHKNMEICLSSTSETTLCSFLIYEKNCVHSSALSCSMEDDKDVKTLLNNSNNEICEGGKPVNINFNNYWECILETIGDSTCSDELNKAKKGLSSQIIYPDKLVKEYFKLECKYEETISNCLVNEIKAKCGNGAVSLLLLRTNTGEDQLSKRLCDYVNGVSRNSSHFFLWVIQVLVLVFISRWSSK